MKSKKLKELKERKDMLFNQLLQSGISAEERVEIRSQYYKASSELYFYKNRPSPVKAA